MNKKLKQIIALTTGVVIAVSLSACCIDTPTQETDTPVVVNPAPVVVDITNDLIPQLNAKDAPVIITDELGSYQKMTINPNDESLKLDTTIVDASVTEAGWTEADTLSAQKWVVTFVAEQGVDSTAVDGNGWWNWMTDQSAKYVAPEWKDIAYEPVAISDRSLFIQNNPMNSTPNLIRDGTPRIKASNITVSRVLSVPSYDEANPQWLVVSGKAVTQYRVTDETMLAEWKAQNPDATKDRIITEHPYLADGKDEIFTMTFDYMYSVRKDAAAGWLFTGYENSFQHKSY